MVAAFPERVPRGRNLGIFWAATLEGKSQAELAREHGISQQRVSQIVCAVRQFMALATSEQYEGIPQQAQLQLGCRIQLEKLSRRRRVVSDAWEASTRPSVVVKRSNSQKHGQRTETIEKSQHGDWRLDRQLGEIDKQTMDTTVLLYERPWFGKEQLRIADCGLRIGEQKRKAEGGKREAEGIRNSECGMRNEGELEAGVGMVEEELDRPVEELGAVGVEAVLGTEYSVLSTEYVVEAETEPETETEVEAEAAVEPAAPESAICNPQSAIAPPPAPATASEPARKKWRTDPICDLSGRRIVPPTDEHRPWRKARFSLRWLLEQAERASTPQGVLLNPSSELLQSNEPSNHKYSANYDAIVPWDEVNRLLQTHLGAAELVAAP